jgi:pimeloyl-ACP methyl ester carboxylesterase
VIPFRVEIPQRAIDDLNYRLDQTRWPEEQPEQSWTYGLPLHYARELAQYWRQSYDWRTHEARINEKPQLLTTIDGTTVHALHVRSKHADALPLILTHGWPSSFVEFLDIIGPLTDPTAYGRDARDAFHVVVPSIPGYGFSGPTHDPGWNVERVARAWDQLMQRLGYDRYGAHGGDWGSRISRQLGRIAPGRVAGVHVSTLRPAVSGSDATALSEADQRRLSVGETFRTDGLGYFAIQSTRPQTLAYGLSDSPVAQMAWIAEKFREWSDCGDASDSSVNLDSLLTNISVYWFTKTGGSSARMYYEDSHHASPGAMAYSSVPTGVCAFQNDMQPPIRMLAERYDNIVHWTEVGAGGHFAAIEQPDILVSDIASFFCAYR